MKRLIALPIAILIMSSCGAGATPTARPLSPLAGNPQLLVSTGGGDGLQQLLLWDVRRHATVRALPMGALSPDGRLLYTVDATAQPHVRAIELASGQTVASAAIPAGFTLPQGESPGSQPIGLSANGAWLALQSVDRTSQTDIKRTRYLVIDTNFRTKPQMVSLDGAWDFDAISDDGQRLYLLEEVKSSAGSSAYESADSSGYRVRLYDLASRALWPQTIVDKRLWGDTMSGSRLVAVPAQDQTWLFSLYAFGPKGPFIHALSMKDDTRIAWCTNLPTGQNSGGEQELLWTMLRSRDGQHLYAVNAGEGIAAEVTLAGDWTPPAVTRTARFAVKQASATSFFGLVLNADAKRFLVGGSVLSADGRILYALGDDGIYAIDTASLKIGETYLTDVPLDSVVQSADGKTLFASSSQQNKIFRIDLLSGTSEVLTSSLQVDSLVALQGAAPPG